VSYQSVLCADNWAGGHDPAALGSVNNLGDSVCCPADPLAPVSTSLVPIILFLTSECRMGQSARPVDPLPIPELPVHRSWSPASAFGLPRSSPCRWLFTSNA
jgi:hypothetical protein